MNFSIFPKNYDSPGKLHSAITQPPSPKSTFSDLSIRFFPKKINPTFFFGGRGCPNLSQYGVAK